MNEQSNELAVVYGDNTSSSALLLEGDSLDRMLTFAKEMANSKVTIPKHLTNSPGDCLAVVMQAVQWKMNPFSVAQKTYLVNGTLGYEAQLVNAVVQSSGAIKGRFHYEYKGEGENLECRVGAVPRDETEIVWSEWLAISKVTTKNSPLWKTNPKQQFGYLQVKNWCRAYAPASIMGVYTPDELTQPELKPMGKAEVIIEDYPADKFDENFPKWEAAILSGKKTPDEIIAMVNSKAPLTDEQKGRILMIKLPTQTPTEEAA